MTAEFDDGVDTGHLSPDAELTFYRVTQEALNNVVKHAHASRVDVILEQRDGAVVLDRGRWRRFRSIRRRNGGAASASPACERAAPAPHSRSNIRGEGTTVFLRSQPTKSGGRCNEQ